MATCVHWQEKEGEKEEERKKKEVYTLEGFG